MSSLSYPSPPAAPDATSPLASDSQKTAQRFKKLVFFTLFLTLDLIMFGAFVRLTDAGLGCPDWPGCYGTISPLHALPDIRAAEQLMPSGPVTLPKAWIEMLHRYVGSILGLLIIAILVMAWRQRRSLQQSPWLPFVLLIGVCLQGAFGAWTVTLKLMPIIVTAHLLGGMTLLALLTWLAARQTALPGGVSLHTPRQLNSAPTWLKWAVLGLGLLYIQIALGGWVSTNYAALACMDFPLCHGELIPPMDLAAAFTFLRPLGLLPNGEHLPLEALTAIHWIHRSMAFIVFIYLGSLALKLKAYPALRPFAWGLIIVLCLQVITGLSTIFFKWPIAVSVIHNGGAALLVMLTTTLIYRLQRLSRVRA